MKNFLFTILTLFIFILIFFSSLNYFLGGVPLFNIFNINITQAVYVSKDENLKKDYEISFKENTKYFAHKCGASENGFYNTAYEPDDFGFRSNPNELFYNTDVIIVGDSFGISSCVNYPFDITTRLKKKINNEKILNISVPGTGPYFQKELLKCLVEKNNTKFNTFIWLFYEGNDHEDLNKYFGREVACKSGYAKGTNNGKIEVDHRPSENFFLLKFKLYLSNYSRGFGTLIKYFKTYPKLLLNDNNYDTTFADLNNYLISKNVEKKIIFYIPKYTRLAYNKINHPQLTQLNNLKKLVEKTAKKYNFDFIDGSEIYHNLEDSLSVFHYRLPTHFNNKGYDILAEELSKKLN